MTVLIDRTFAQAFAAEWCAAWNAGDLEGVLSHYDDDFEMRSPLMIERGFSATGSLKGKDAIRPYWKAGIETAKPALVFELIDVYVGAQTIAIHYRSVGRGVVIEVIEFDERKKGIRASACYVRA